jgi:hypothetical protein
MKNLSMLIIFLLFTSSTNGQELKPCKLGLANAPVVRGVKLGMTPLQVEKTLGLKIILKDYKPYPTDEILVGVKKYYFLKELNKKISTQLQGINLFELTFYNNTLYNIFIIYEKSKVDWKDSKEFALYLSDKFDLPKNAWLTDGRLLCNEFDLITGIGQEGNPLLGLINNKISNTVYIKERQIVEKYKSQKRVVEIENEKGFKP